MNKENEYVGIDNIEIGGIYKNDKNGNLVRIKDLFSYSGPSIASHKGKNRNIYMNHYITFTPNNLVYPTYAEIKWFEWCEGNNTFIPESEFMLRYYNVDNYEIY